MKNLCSKDKGFLFVYLFIYYTAFQKSHAHQGCFYLINNEKQSYREIVLQFKNCFLDEYILKCNLLR